MAVVADKAACEACGYELRGLGVGVGGVGPEAVCPECGAGFDVDQPWVPSAWPRRWVLWARMCGPTLALAAGLVVLGAVPELKRWLVWPVWLVWLGCLVYFSVRCPWTIAKEVAACCEPRVGRASAARRVSWGPIIVNVVVGLAGLVGFWGTW